jgi:hypothetical protein
MDSFEEIFSWLDIGNRPMPAIYRTLIQQANLQAETGKTNAAQATLRDLHRTAREMGNDLIRARVELESARIEVKLQDPSQSLLNVRKAIEILDRYTTYDTECRHFRFIASWLMGVLLWPASRPKAVAAWQNSLDDIHFLWRQYKHLVPEGDWYHSHQEEMKRQIEAEIRAGLSRFARPTWRPLPLIELHTPKNRILPIVGEIPAGRSGPAANDVEPIDEIEIPRCADEFLLGGVPYGLYNLRSEAHSLVLSPSQSYYILKVNGDSMDLTGIQPGDFVLMRAQTEAQNGDIVAAEVVEADSCATLKYFSRRRGKIILRPQSSNPDYRPVEFTPDDRDNFFIRGTCLGVFKAS